MPSCVSSHQLHGMADPWYEEQPDVARGANRIKQLMAGPGNREVIHKLVRWTVIMFTAPFIAYFGCTNILNSGPIWAGISACVVVQVVIFGYVFVAFTEDLEVDQEGDSSQSSSQTVSASSTGGKKKR